MFSTWIRQWVARFYGSPSRRQRKNSSQLRRRFRPSIECLEDRVTPSFGQVSLGDLFTGSTASNPGNYTFFDNHYYFTATNATGPALYKWDGSASSIPPTVLMQFDTVSGVRPNGGFLVEGTKMYFAASTTSTSTTQLWELDAGSSTPFTQVTKFVNPSNATDVNGTVYLTAAASASVRSQLWVTNGTDAGSSQLTSGFNSPFNLTALGTTLYFSNNPAGTGYELYRLDASNSVIQLTSGTDPFGDGPFPADLTVSGSTLYMREFDTATSFTTHLYKITNSDSGTSAVSGAPANPGDLTDVNGTLFFIANDGAGVTQVWNLSGGTVNKVTSFTAQTKYPATDLTNVNGTLYFAADDVTHGSQLWKDAAGTVSQVDIPVTGSAAAMYPGSYPRELTNVNGTLFFTATNVDNYSSTNKTNFGQYAVWTSNGTLANTYEIVPTNINPQPAGDPRASGLVNAGGHLFYSQVDTTHGREPWLIGTSPSITSASSTTFKVGTNGSFTITTGGFPFPTVTEFTAAGQTGLPGGVSLTDNHNGTFTLGGTPNAGTGGIWTFTLKAHNGVSPDDVTQTFTLTVNEAPRITSANSTSFPVATAGTFTVNIAHCFSSGTAQFTPTVSVPSGTLPTGVTFTDNHNGTATQNATATISYNGLGTAGRYTFTITASNGVSPDAMQTFTLDLVAPPTIAAAFNPADIRPNGTSTLTFTITNPSVNQVAETGVAFTTDTLPAGLKVASPNGAGTTIGGTVTATAGGTTISFSGGTVGVNGSGTVTVNVTSAATGVYTDTTGTVSSTNGGSNSQTASATLTVANAPTVSEQFGASLIPLNGGLTSLTISISNPNTNVDLSNLAFTDSLPAGLVVATPNNLNSTGLGGTVTATAGSGTITLSGGSLAANHSGTINLNVTGTTAGVKNNSFTVSSTEGGSSASADASITVVAPPSISDSFVPSTIPVGGVTTLSFTITNPNATQSLTGVGFTDTLPAGLVINTPNGQSGTFGGGTLTDTQGTSTISLSGATLAAGGSFTFSVNVQGTATGTQTNNTSGVSSNEGGTGSAAPAASVTVLAPPSITAAFNPTSIPVSGTSTLTFTITNPAVNTVDLTGVAVNDTLPSGLTVASGTSSVGGGTLTRTSPTSISLSGATIAANTQLQFSVTVTGAAVGPYTDTTGAVSSTNGGTGNTGTADLTVVPAEDLVVSMSGPATVIAGSGTGNLVYTVTVKNNGPSDATGVQLTNSNNTLPSGVTFVGGSTATGTFTNGTGVWDVGNLANGASATLTVTYTVDHTAAAGTNVISDTAAVTAANEILLNTSNDSATKQTSITPQADLSITKSGPSDANISDPNGFDYTLTVTDNGPSDNTGGFTVTDVLPTGTTFQSTGSTAGASVNGQTIKYSNSTGLADGAQQTFTIHVTVPSSVTDGTVLNNSATVATTGTTDPTSSNNTSTTVHTTAHLQVYAVKSITDITHPGGPFQAGDTVQYQVVITNPSNLPNITGTQFTDTLDTNISLVNGTVHASPVAFNDTYSDVGNTKLYVGTTPAAGEPSIQLGSGLGILADDVALTDSISFTGSTVATSQGGSVTVNNDGTFTYTPKTGFTGADTFTYTIKNSADSTLTSTATVTINVGTKVWYVDDSKSNGTGTAASPFNTLAGAISAASSGDIIYLFKGNANYAAATLGAGEQLVGAGVDLVVAGNTLIAGSSANTPTIGGTLTLANNDSVSGLTISSGTSTGLSAVGTSGAHLGETVSQVSVTSTTGTAVNLAFVDGSLSFSSISANGATNGISLSNTTGSFTVTGDGASDPTNTTRGRTTAKLGGGTITLGSGGTIQNSTGSGIVLSSAANVTLRNMVIQNNGSGLKTGKDGMTVTNGSALTLDNTGISGSTDQTGGTSGNNGLHATGLNGLTLEHCEIHDNATNSGVAGGTEAWNVRLDEVTGTVTVDNSHLYNSYAMVMGTVNHTTTSIVISVTNSTFDGGSSNGGSSLLAQAFDTASLTLSFIGSTSNNGRNGEGVDANYNNSSTGSFTVKNSSFDNNGIDNGGGADINVASTKGNVTFDIESNTTRMNTTVPSGGSAGTSISADLAGTANSTSVLQGKILNNTVGNSSVAESASTAGAGIAVQANAGIMTVNISGNTVNQSGSEGIAVLASGVSAALTATINVTLHNNSATVTNNVNAADGLSLTAGGGGFADTVNANVSGNVKFDASNNVNAIGGVNAVALGGATINLQGYTGAANNSGQLITFLNGVATTVNPTSNVLIGTSPQSTIQGTSSTVLTPTGGPITLAPATLAAATVGVSYTPVSVVASGGTSPYTYSSVGLPAGLTLTTSGVNAGQISGTPMAAGTFTFTVQATDSASITGSRSYTLTVNPPSISLGSLPNATAGTAYSQTITPTGGTSPFTFAITSGALPDGLSLNTSSGLVSGTPTAPGIFSFIVKATDSSTGTGAPFSVSKTYTLSVADGGSSGNSTSSTTVNIGSVLAGKSVTVEFQATVANPFTAIPRQISNQATVTFNNGSPQTIHSNTVTTPIAAKADLALTSNNDSPDPVIAGNDITYTIDFINNGPDSAGNATITDAVPTGTTFVSAAIASGTGWSISQQPAVGGTGNVVFSKSGVANGETATFTVVVKTLSSDADASTITDTATVSTTDSNTTDSTSSNNSQTATTTVNTQADLSISKSGPSTAVAGDPAGFNYTLTVTNNGASDNTGGFTVTDVLPTGLTFQSTGSTAGASVTGQQVTYTNSTGLAASGTQTFTIHVTLASSVADGTVLADSATVATTGTTDPTSSNNSSSTVNTTVQTSADLSIAKSGPGTATAGDPNGFDYTLTVTNNGVSDNTGGFTVTDVLPTGLTFQSTGSTAGTSATGQTVTFTNSTGLISGAQQTITIHVTLASSVASGTVLHDSATVATNGTTDPTSSNNTSNTVDTTVHTSADLSISKSAPSTAGIGDPGGFDYTLTVTDNGPSDNTGGFTVTDVLPTGTTFQSTGSTAGASVTGQTVTYTNSTGLANGAQQTFTIHVTVASTVTDPTVLSNSATVATNGTADPTSSNNTSNTVDTTARRGADLSISKSGPATALAGDAAGFDYTLTVTNNGPLDNVGGFTVTDVLPTGSTFDPTSSTTGASVNGQTITYTNSTGLTNGAQQTFTIHVTVASTVADGTVLQDTATVATNGTVDSNTSNNTSNTVDTTVQAPADLSIAKSGPATAIAGAAAGFDYTLTVTNNGPFNNVSGFTVTDVLPTDTVFQSTSSTAGASVTGQTIKYTNSTGLANGATQTFTIHVTLLSSVADGTILANNAIVATSGTTDNNSANDTSNTVDTTVQAQADLVITKSGPTTVTAGTDVTYTITLVNNGPSDAQNVSLTDVVPAGTTFVSATPVSGSNPDGFSYSLLKRTVTGTLTDGVVAAGNTDKFTLVVHAPSSDADGSQISNTATVTTTTTDDDETVNDETATVISNVITQADLSITKSGPSTAVAGDPNGFDYTLTVTNNGSSDNTGGFTVTDILPTGTIFQSGASTPGASANGQTITYTNSTGLVSGAQQVFTIHVTVPSSVADGTVLNDSATVATNGTTDPTSSNNTSIIVNTSVSRQVDLAVTKIGPTTVVAGSGAGNVVYVVTVKNNGPSDASGVSLSEATTLEFGVTVDSVIASSGTSFAGTNGTGTWTVGNLVSGASATLTLTLTAGSSAAAGTNVISDTATRLSDNEGDTNSLNDIATVSTSVTRQVDLAVTKTGPTSVVEGSGTGNVVYVVTVKNNGPSDASDVTVSESTTREAGVTVDSVVGNAPSLRPFTWRRRVTWFNGTNGTGTLVIPDLTAGTSATLTLTLTVSSSAAPGINVIGDTATLLADNEGDTNSANNSATVSTSVYQLPVVTTNPTDQTLNAGQVVTFTAAANGFPAPTVQWQVSSDGGVNFTDIAGATSTTLSFTTTATQDRNKYRAVFTNAAGTATTSAATLSLVVLNITQSSSPTNVVAGGTLTYTLTIINTGSADANGVVVQEQLPTNTTFVGGNVTWTPNGSGLFTFNQGTPVSGGSIVLTFIVKVNTGTPTGTQITNDVSLFDSLSALPVVINSYTITVGSRLR
jgi:uncharacterized repeat protein (TIGR01451 family)